MAQVELYDTTLRDGAQYEGISLSVEDKLTIADRLDQLGVHYIEGGWPGSNPKDAEFFERPRASNSRTRSWPPLAAPVEPTSRPPTTPGFRRCWRRKRPL